MSNSLVVKDSSTQKMSFSQTCNLLSQFVKEKRAFGIPTNLDAALGEGYNRSTMNLFPLKQAEGSNGSVGRTINLFPEISGFNPSAKKRASPEPPSAQMTIFYNGQVVVFNDLPADKANEVMNLASRIESTLKMRKVETPASLVPVSVPVTNQNSNLNPNPSQIHSENMAASSPSFGNHVIPATAAVPPALVPRAGLSLSRKDSLHRFLEKRKDRLVGKAPPSANAAEGITGAGGKAAWLGLNSLPVFQQKQQQHL